MAERAFHAAIIYWQDEEELADYAHLLLAGTGMDLLISPWGEDEGITAGALHIMVGTPHRAPWMKRKDLLVLGLDEACRRYGISGQEFL